MLVPEMLLNAIADFSSLALIEEMSQINIDCHDADPEEVKSFVEEELSRQWNHMWRGVMSWDEDEIEAAEEANEFDPFIKEEDGKVIAFIEHPVVRDQYEEDAYCDFNFVEEAFVATKEKFPGISMSGFIIVDYAGHNCGEILMAEIDKDGKIVSDETMVHDQIGLLLKAIFSDDEEGVPPFFVEELGGNVDEVWDFLASEAEESDYVELQKCFDVYRDYLPESAFETLEEAMEEME